MAGTWKDIPSAVVASTFYVDGSLAARNPTMTLPEISRTTAELKAGGTVEVPVGNHVDAMEATVTLGAADEDFAKACEPGSHEYEARWVQDKMGVDGSVKQVGYKAFMRGYPKTIPGVSLETGEASENELTIGVTRYQLFADGAELLCIDQLNDVFKVNGTDFGSDISSLL